jgi:AcrR family transcriptional regulator
MARTKSAQAHGKVLDAALQFFAERGIEASSMDAIAEASGVSKATIYKHWKDKDALALEALSRLLELHEDPPVFDTGNLCADIAALLNYEPAKAQQEFKSRIMPHVMVYAARNREFGDQWRARAMERPRKQLEQLLRRGIQSGELTPDLDLEVSIALLLGPMLYRHIFLRHTIEKLPENFASRVADTFCRAFAQDTLRSV